MRYRLLQPTTLNPGARLVLTSDQLRRRQGFVVPQVGAWVLAVKPVSFKAGEVIELDGYLPKVLAAELLDVDPGAPPAPAVRPSPDLGFDGAADADTHAAAVETSARSTGGKRRGSKRP